MIRPAGPIVLAANQPADRFYRGGSRISGFRGVTSTATHSPEDWVASTTSVRNDGPVGQSTLPSGELLSAALASDPVGWLGQAHLDAFGPDTKILVKLLDAGQRLPVHAHPAGDFAFEHLAAAHGKAEAWYILSPGVVYLGLNRDVTPAELEALVLAQDTAALLCLLNRIDVARHDTVFVPPGVLHAIGEGVFLAEVQEPEDLSILLEWEGFDLDGAADGHLGLGFELALSAVELTARSAGELAALVTTSELVDAATEYFRLERSIVAGSTVLAEGFSIVIVLEGEVELSGESGGAVCLRRGSTVVVPHSAGAVTLRGAGEALVARPPAT